MARKGNQNHKKKYERCKSSGTLILNKQEKQKKAEARKKHFAERKEAGKAYEYKAPSGTEREIEVERAKRAAKVANSDHRLPYAKWASAFAIQERELREAEEKSKKLAKKLDKAHKVA